MLGDFAIVDDNKFDRLICNRIIKRLNEQARMKEFDSAESTLHYLKTHQDLEEKLFIFLDINMPEMSGFELLDQLISDGMIDAESKRFRIVFVTSSTREEDKLKAESYPFVKGILQKPIRIDDVERVLNAA